MMSGMKTIIYNAWKEVVVDGKVYYDFGDSVYNYIKEKKLMVVDEDMIEKAKSYAKANVKSEQYQSNIKSVIKNIKFDKVNAESIKRKKAREYIVNLWLSSMNKIKADSFIKQMKFYWRICYRVTS